VVEFGCCTYRGAADRGGAGWLVVDEHQQTIAADLVRDETEPERYFQELLDLFDGEGVDAAFWFTFAGYELPHRPADPRRDLDLASYGLVAMLEQGRGIRYPDMAWEPKRLFDTLAARYAAAVPAEHPEGTVIATGWVRSAGARSGVRGRRRPSGPAAPTGARRGSRARSG
jgi:hypothetical protein